MNAQSQNITGVDEFVDVFRNTAASFNDMRKNSILTDVILRCDGAEFSAHKSFLAASSAYFYSMFTCGLKETKNSYVDLKEVDAQGLEMLLEYFYTGKMKRFTKLEDIISIMETSHLMQLNSIYNQYKQYLMEYLSESTYKTVWDIGEKFQDEMILASIDSFLLNKTESLLNTEEFLLLDFNRIEKAVYSIMKKVTDCSLLGIEMVCKWINYDKEHRSQFLKPLLSALHLDHLPYSSIDKLYHSSTVQDCPQVKTALCQLTEIKQKSLTDDFSFESEVLKNGNFQVVLIGEDFSQKVQILIYSPIRKSWSSVKLPKLTSPTEIMNTLYDHKEGTMYLTTDSSAYVIDVNKCILNPANENSVLSSIKLKIKKYFNAVTIYVKEKIYLLGLGFEVGGIDNLYIDITNCYPNNISWQRMTQLLKSTEDAQYSIASDYSFSFGTLEHKLYVLIVGKKLARKICAGRAKKLIGFEIDLDSPEPNFNEMFVFDLPFDFPKRRWLTAYSSGKIFIKHRSKHGGFICDLQQKSLTEMGSMANEPEKVVALTSWKDTLWALDGTCAIHVCNIQNSCWQKIVTVPGTNEDLELKEIFAGQR